MQIETIFIKISQNETKTWKVHLNIYVLKSEKLLFILYLFYQGSNGPPGDEGPEGHPGPKVGQYLLLYSVARENAYLCLTKTQECSQYFFSLKRCFYFSFNDVLTESALKVGQMYNSTFKCEKTRSAFILWKCQWEHIRKCPPTPLAKQKNNTFCCNQKTSFARCGTI